MGARENTALVEEYLTRIGKQDPSFEKLLADDVVWWVPPGSEAGGTYRGKATVLDFIRSGSGKYSATAPFEITIERVVADDEWAAVQLIIDTKTADGRDYRNHYHIAFEIRDGEIVFAKEYPDTKYAHDVFAQE